MMKLKSNIYYYADLAYKKMKNSEKELVEEDVKYYTCKFEEYSFDRFFDFFHKSLIECKPFRNVFYYRCKMTKNNSVIRCVNLFLEDYPLLPSVEINCNDIKGGLRILHNTCVISCEKIGERCSIGPLVVIGGKDEGKPIIGNDVNICAGAIIIGAITIGDNALI